MKLNWLDLVGLTVLSILLSLLPKNSILNSSCSMLNALNTLYFLAILHVYVQCKLYKVHLSCIMYRVSCIVYVRLKTLTVILIVFNKVSIQFREVSQTWVNSPTNIMISTIFTIYNLLSLYSMVYAPAFLPISPSSSSSLQSSHFIGVDDDTELLFIHLSFSLYLFLNTDRQSLLFYYCV